MSAKPYRPTVCEGPDVHGPHVTFHRSESPRCDWLLISVPELPQEVRLAQTAKETGSDLRSSIGYPRMAGIGVRRDKAALSSGCKAHPAIRSSRKQSEQSWR
jgi:hypothetical protein